MLVKIFYILEFFIFQGLMHEIKNIISFLFHRPTWRCQKKKKAALQVLWKRRYSVFLLSRDIRWSHYQRDTYHGQIEPLTLSDHPNKYGVCRS